MTERNARERPISVRASMIIGGVWSFASVGWIAIGVLVWTLFTSGWIQALFWFGAILLFGAGIFLSVLVVAAVCELFNLSEKRSRRDSIHYFGWALTYNLILGALAIAVALKFRNL